MGWGKLEQNFWLRSRHQERESLISGVEEKELSSQDPVGLEGSIGGGRAVPRPEPTRVRIRRGPGAGKVLYGVIKEH